MLVLLLHLIDFSPLKLFNFTILFIMANDHGNSTCTTGMKVLTLDTLWCNLPQKCDKFFSGYIERVLPGQQADFILDLLCIHAYSMYVHVYASNV